MSLNFSCIIQTVWLDFCESNMEAWTHSALCQTVQVLVRVIAWGNFFFLQQDKKPSHKAQIDSKCLPKHEHDFAFSQWSPQSPDVLLLIHEDLLKQKMWSLINSKTICEMLSCQHGPKSTGNVSNAFFKKQRCHFAASRSLWSSPNINVRLQNGDKIIKLSES